MKKTEEPPALKIVLIREDENSSGGKDPSASIHSQRCSCAEGKFLCLHTIAFPYTLVNYQMLGLKNVLPIISKTSKPQVSKYAGRSPYEYNVT